MRAYVPLFALLFTACPPPSSPGTDKDGAADSGDTGADEGRTFEDFVNVTTAWTGNTDECIAGKVQDVDPSCIVDMTINGEVSDFQTEDAVPDTTVQVWFNDDIFNTADVTTQADGDGNFSFDAPSCTPIAYGTFTPPEWEETKDTYEVHQVFGYAGDGSSDEIFNSVSEATSRLIPSLIGIEWEEETTGIIAGTAYDCDIEPMQYVQIFLHDGNGTPPATGEVFYFSESGGTSLPTDKDSQPHSNTNGLWVAMNVPEGTWTVEAWGWDAGTSTHVKLGATVLQIAAGSVNISNIYTGISDGIWYPGSCLSACGG
ncbi:MAG: hypothetical protein ACK4YP_01890 [Myxococcota bacterium]